tara:strand:- start:62 stop:898 length:837 start_codon:yes stop_codon:yes gene_type:complete
MKVIRNFVEELNLSDGERYRGKCPVCKRANTFTATNNMGKLLYNCYANSCTISGATTTTMTIQEIKTRMKTLEINPDENKGLNISKGEVFPESVVSDANRHIVDGFCERYSIDSQELDLRYDIKEDRVVFPIFDQGRLVDGIGKAISDNVIPKWKRYGTMAGGYIRGECVIAVVVEDCISAAVVETLGLTGVAILGTALTDSHIFALKEFKKVIVALDPDAAPKTIAYTKQLKSNGIDAFALKLLDDIKYRREEDIKYLLKLKGEFNSGTQSIKESAD